MARLIKQVLTITAADSPNVRREMLRRQGVPESAWPPETPGVLSWEEYQTRLSTWDAVRVAIGLNAQFWEGSDSLLYPPAWLDRSAKRALQLSLQERHGHLARAARALGCDPGEGGDAERLGTAWCVVDEHGVLELTERRTSDTSVIGDVTKSLVRKWKVDPRRCCFDRGGGGKQVADYLRRDGLPVRTVGFGEAVGADPRRGKTRFPERLEAKEDRYAYVSRRAQMYHELRLLLDPGLNAQPFAIPSSLAGLRQELAPIPLQYDKEGRITLPPKHRAGKRQAGQDKTLTELIGHSPDNADALVLAVHAMQHQEQRARAGGLGGAGEYGGR